MGMSVGLLTCEEVLEEEIAAWPGESSLSCCPERLIGYEPPVISCVNYDALPCGSAHRNAHEPCDSSSINGTVRASPLAKLYKSGIRLPRRTGRLVCKGPSACEVL